MSGGGRGDERQELGGEVRHDHRSRPGLSFEDSLEQVLSNLADCAVGWVEDIGDIEFDTLTKQDAD
jgi:hypothetical protein